MSTSDKLQHVGLHAGRLNHPCSAREEAFAKRWRKENTPQTWLNHGRGVLDHLLYMSPGQDCFTGEATEREEQTAASVIQWLGSNCGWCFLEEVLRDCGFVIREAHLKYADPPPAERAAFDSGTKAMRDAIIEAIRKDQAWVDLNKVRDVKAPEFGRRG